MEIWGYANGDYLTHIVEKYFLKLNTKELTDGKMMDIL